MDVALEINKKDTFCKFCDSKISPQVFYSFVPYATYS